MTPRERIARASPTRIREKYESECNLSGLIAGEQFRTIYEDSGHSSVEPLAHLAGISPHTFRRIMNGKSLPDVPTFEAARNRLIDFFGEPQVDMAHIRSVKREKAVGLVLDALGFELGDIASGLDERSPISAIARLSASIVPPEHSILASFRKYEDWKAELVQKDVVTDVETADAVGTFVAAREYLDGFLDRIVAEAKQLYRTTRDSRALELLASIRGISIAWASFKTHGADWQQLRRNLQQKVNLERSPHSVTNKSFVTELVKRWALSVEDFLVTDTTPAYLLMESQVVRPLALHVLAANFHNQSK